LCVLPCRLLKSKEYRNIVLWALIVGVLFTDPDFNPFMDLQAQSRAHRIGQTRPVVVYQLITKCSVEEKILQKSKQKLAIENMLMNSSSKKPNADELQSILLHGAKTIIDKKKISATSIHYDDEAIENLLKLDPSSEEKCSKDDNGYLGSIVSFAHGMEDEEPGSPKVEDLKVLKPATPKVDLGRGKRQRRVVNYNDAVENSDSDDMYAPEGSSSSISDDDSDNDNYEANSVISAPVAPASETLNIVPAIGAPGAIHALEAPNIIPAIGVPGAIPALEAPKACSNSSSSSSSDDNGDKLKSATLGSILT
jgi:chromodomain-helicase-DNA-binding protein 4